MTAPDSSTVSSLPFQFEDSFLDGALAVSFSRRVLKLGHEASSQRKKGNDIIITLKLDKQHPKFVNMISEIGDQDLKRTVERSLANSLGKHVTILLNSSDSYGHLTKELYNCFAMIGIDNLPQEYLNEIGTGVLAGFRCLQEWRKPEASSEIHGRRK